MCWYNCSFKTNRNCYTLQKQFKQISAINQRLSVLLLKKNSFYYHRNNPLIGRLKATMAQKAIRNPYYRDL
jgi:hypothetical protein